MPKKLSKAFFDPVSDSKFRFGAFSVSGVIANLSFKYESKSPLKSRDPNKTELSAIFPLGTDPANTFTLVGIH